MDEFEKAADDDLLVVARQKPIHELLGELIQREDEQGDQKNAAIGGIIHRGASARLSLWSRRFPFDNALARRRPIKVRRRQKDKSNIAENGANCNIMELIECFAGPTGGGDKKS
jgi:hypothetical protein